MYLNTFSLLRGGVIKWAKADKTKRYNFYNQSVETKKHKCESGKGG
jgi:hypothetical protein